MENEHLMMMRIHQEANSVQGQIDRVKSELERAGKDPRHANKRKELQTQLVKLQRALYRKDNPS
ncbi:MAG: hypothetical protein WC457_00090 [Patescibacteria group bacterium]